MRQNPLRCSRKFKDLSAKRSSSFIDRKKVTVSNHKNVKLKIDTSPLISQIPAEYILINIKTKVYLRTPIANFYFSILGQNTHKGPKAQVSIRIDIAEQERNAEEHHESSSNTGSRRDRCLGRNFSTPTIDLSCLVV